MPVALDDGQTGNRGGTMMVASESNAAEVLASYRRWKEDGKALKTRAQSFLMERFSELIREAQQVQHDLWEDFGQTVKFPANPKMARKGKGRSAPRNATPALRPVAERSALAPQRGGATSTAPPAAPAGRVTDSLTAAATVRRTTRPSLLRGGETRSGAAPAQGKKRHLLMRQIAKAQARLEQVRALGDPVKLQNAEDRLYELNDDLRLLDEAE